MSKAGLQISVLTLRQAQDKPSRNRIQRHICTGKQPRPVPTLFGIIVTPQEHQKCIYVDTAGIE